MIGKEVFLFPSLFGSTKKIEKKKVRDESQLLVYHAKNRVWRERVKNDKHAIFMTELGFQILEISFSLK